MVQVPRLQKLQTSSAMPSNDRIKIQAPNSADDILSRTNAVAGVAETVIKVHDAIEDSTITQLSQAAEQEFNEWNTQELAKLKGYQGDPTEAYNAHDAAINEKYKQLISSNPDVSERVKAGLQANLGKAVNSQNLTVLKQRGAQQETYSNNLYVAQKKLEKNAFGDAFSNVQKDADGKVNPSLYRPVNDNITKITNTITTRALEKGTATKSEDGKITLSPIAQAELNKELAEGIGASISSMMIENPDIAKDAMMRYNYYLSPNVKAKLNTKIETAGVKAAALSEMDKIKGKSESEQMKYIASKSTALQSEMLKIKDGNDSRVEHIKNRKEKTNYEYMAKDLLKRQSGNNPYHGLADLENDPKYKAVEDNLSAKSIKTLHALVNAPKETDPKAKVKMQNLIFGNEGKNLEDMTTEEVAEYMPGLSKADQNKLWTKHEKAKNPSSGEINSLYRVAGLELQEALLVSGDIEENKYGKIAGDDKITLLRAQDRVEEAIARGLIKDRKDAKEFIQKERANLIKEQYTSSVKKPAMAPSPKDPASTAPAKKNEVVLSPSQIVDLKKKFQKANGYIPVKTDPKFLNFIESNK